MNTLTNKQQKVLNFYTEYIQKNGYAPTYREASEFLGVKASVAFTHVKNLAKKGCLLVKGGSIKLSGNNEQIPLLGLVACGSPISVYEECSEYVDVPKSSLKGGGSFYALKAFGKSMIKAGIDDGDTLVIRQQSDVSDGDIGVVVVGEYADDERATLKRVYHTPKALILKPENDDFPTQIITEPSQVRGKLVSVIRNY